jgi:ferric-dicitrate binding protein FerR (iron transport regulator)
MYARLITAAAGILLLALLLPRLINSRNDSRTEIADTDVKTIQLEDGSKVYLRKGSTLQYPAVFAGDTRRVTLTGEAFFEVAPDATKPFIIKAAGTEVQVVGTSFSVNTANDKVELIVKTGRVNFSPAGDAAKKILVVAGERAVYANSSMTKLANADNNFNAWQSKQLVFTSTPLDQVAAVLSNYYNVTIRLRKEDAGQMAATTVTATFDNQPLSSVLDELSLITTNHIQKISETDYEISLK